MARESTGAEWREFLDALDQFKQESAGSHIEGCWQPGGYARSRVACKASTTIATLYQEHGAPMEEYFNSPVDDRSQGIGSLFVLSQGGP